MTDKTKTTKQPKTNKQALPVHGLWGIALLFVIVSIIYMATVIVLGTEGLYPKVATAPAVLFSVLVLFYKFNSK